MVTEVLGSSESSGSRDEIIDSLPGGPELGACTQVTALMYNPATGDVVRATDGCEIESLRKSGYTTDVPPDMIKDYYSGDNGGSDTDQDDGAGAQSAGVGIGLIAALGAGALYFSQ